MTHPAWPMLALRISVDGLLLRPFRESDLAGLARLLPDDVELNPASPVYPGAAPGTERATVVHQDYWRAMGSWTTSAWRLNFVVLRDDEVVGAQELEGNDFALLRTVDTASFLVADARGRGIGKAMRRGVLALAFGPLGAECAITSAWHDNTASLGVSRSLGYIDNGVSRHPRGERADDLVHLRLTRDAWLASGHADGVDVVGAAPCLPYFGL